jgi:hypothetical protein
MQSWSSRDLAWMPMGGRGPWRNRDSPVDAAAKCLSWTGLIGIPAMQVVDVQAGAVVWRISDRYPEAGPTVVLPLDDEILAWERATEALGLAADERPADESAPDP